MKTAVTEMFEKFNFGYFVFYDLNCGSCESYMRIVTARGQHWPLNGQIYRKKVGIKKFKWKNDFLFKKMNKFSINLSFLRGYTYINVKNAMSKPHHYIDEHV